MVLCLSDKILNKSAIINVSIRAKTNKKKKPKQKANKPCDLGLTTITFGVFNDLWCIAIDVFCNCNFFESWEIIKNREKQTNNNYDKL